METKDTSITSVFYAMAMPILTVRNKWLGILMWIPIIILKSSSGMLAAMAATLVILYHRIPRRIFYLIVILLILSAAYYIMFYDVTGRERFTLGIATIAGGFDIVPIAMGLFGISEILLNLSRSEEGREVFQTKLHDLFPSKQDWKDFRADC